MNVGASAPEEAGQYFSWGNTDGHTPGDGYEFTQARYNNTPGSEVTGQLPLANDAARVNMGGDWRLPSHTEFRELVNNCTILWTTQNGVAGALFTSNINGNSIFFPAAGYISSNGLEAFGEAGSYWSSTDNENNKAYILTFDERDTNPDDYIDRFIGITLRAVQ